MTNAAGNATTYQPGDRVVFNDNMVGPRTYTITALEDLGLRLRLADEHGVDLGWPVMAYDVTPVNEDASADVEMVEGIIANIENADQPAPAPVSLTAQAGTNVVRFSVLNTGAYRVEAENSHGGLIKYDTPHGVDTLARSYAAQSTARSVARDLTILLRAGLSPAAVASLTINS